jgi:Lrp/AsnC family leucine-responsive transcriptional regulator
LEREGVIRGYTTLLDPEALGQGLVAFVGIRTHGGQDQEQLFERFVVDEPQILECHDVDGEYDYLLKVRTSSPRALRALLASIRSLSGVDRTFTSIALLTVKEIGASAFTPTHDREDL